MTLKCNKVQQLLQVKKKLNAHTFRSFISFCDSLVIVLCGSFFMKFSPETHKIYNEISKYVFTSIRVRS